MGVCALPTANLVVWEVWHFDEPPIQNRLILTDSDVALQNLATVRWPAAHIHVLKVTLIVELVETF